MSPREIFNFVAEGLFQELHADETLNVSFRGEDTDFIRWTQGQVRQNTSVEQMQIGFELHKAGRRVTKSWSVQGSQEWDLIQARQQLQEARTEAAVLPEDPYLVAFENNGNSEAIFRGRLLEGEALIKAIAQPSKGHDLAGLYAGGTIHVGNRNSKGQNHWFSNETFFMDYSLYNGANAAKSCYAGFEWVQADFENSLKRTAEQLQVLEKPRKKLDPGKYQVYLAPAAVAELSGMLSWGALSYRSLKTGGSAFKKLYEKERELSSHFSVSENFDLGLVPRFNEIGELAPTKMDLIREGKLQQFLVSSRSAKEFGTPGNQASASEAPRALEIAPGSLSRENILKKIGTGLYLSNLHYLNWSDLQNARVTGMTRYACLWVENGKIVAPIEDMRFDVSLYDILGADLEAVTDFQEVDPAVDTYEQRSLGGKKVPGFLIKNFSLTL